MYLLPLNTGFSFPNDNVPSSEKSTKEWGSNVGRALYSRFCLGGTYGWGYNDLAGIRLVRDYGDGVQDESIYRNYHTNGSSIGSPRSGGFSGSGQSGGSNRHSKLMNTQARLSMANISYRPYNPIPKFSSTLISMICDNDYYVDFTSVDKESIDAKTEKKIRTYYTATKINPLSKELGLPQTEIPFEVESWDDIEIAESRGYFKTDIERSLERLAQTGFNISNWVSDVRRKTNKDAIDFNFRCVKLENESTGAVKIRYVDVTKLVVLWNDNQTDPVAIGDIRLVDIQSIYNDLVRSRYTEEDIAAVAKTYQGQQIDAWTNDSSLFERRDPLTNKWGWLDFKVPVLSFEYLSQEKAQYVYGKDKSGKTFYKRNDKPLSDEEKEKEKKNREVEYDDFKFNCWYEGNYIIGTDKIFGWRKKPNQVQGSMLNPVSSYVFDKAIDNGQSLTQRAMPLADDLMFAVLKKRAAVFAAAPKGFEVDLGESANIKIGGQEFSVWDLMFIHRQSGIRIKHSKMNAATGKVTSTPVKEIENGLGVQGQEWLNEIAACVYQIASVFGITEATAATPTSDGDKAVGVWEGEVMSTTHANYPLQESDRRFKEKVASRYALQARINIKFDEKAREFYLNQLGKETIEHLQAANHVSLEQLGIVARAVPNKKTKEMIIQRAIEMSKIATRDGSTYLTPADVDEISDLLERDDIEGARKLMKKLVTMNIKRSERVAKEQAELTFKGQQESVMVSEQAKQATIAAQLQADLQRIDAEKKKEVEVESVKLGLQGQNKIEEVRAKGEEDMNQLLVEIEGEKQTGKNIRNDKT